MTDAADRRAQAIVEALLSLAEQASGRTLRFNLIVHRDGRSVEPVGLMVGLVAASLREFRREADEEHEALAAVAAAARVLDDEIVTSHLAMSGRAKNQYALGMHIRATPAVHALREALDHLDARAGT